MIDEPGVSGSVVRLGPRAARSATSAGASPGTGWDGTLTTPIEITAPDRESAGLLLVEAGSRLRLEVVETAGRAVVIRLQPTGTGGHGAVDPPSAA